MLPEGFRVVVAQKDADPVLRNLFEFYLHDMAEWFRFDQLPSGNYTHDTAPYWMPGRKVHLLYANDVPIGFGLTQPGAQWSPEQEATDMEEFLWCDVIGAQVSDANLQSTCGVCTRAPGSCVCSRITVPRCRSGDGRWMSSRATPVGKRCKT